MRTWISLVPLAVALALAAGEASAEPAASELPEYQTLAEAELGGAALPIRGRVLRRDVFELHLEEGTLHLGTPVRGRHWLGVFEGKGRMRLAPASAAERDHLRLILNDPMLEALDEPVESAVLVWTDETAAELDTLAAQPAEASRGAKGRPGKLRKLMRNSLGVELELRVLQDLLGQQREGMFLAWLEGKRHGKLLYILDPLGAASTISLEESGLFNDHDERGGWWYLAQAASADPAALRAPRLPFEPLRYQLETTIDKRERLDVTARIRLRARGDGQRLIRLGLHGKLDVTAAVLLPERTPLTVIEPEDDESNGIGVVLPAAPAAGSEIEIEIAYNGKGILRQLDKDTFFVSERVNWYPNVARFQQFVPYELSFCVPKGLQLVAVGKRLWAERRGNQECSAWQSETPFAVAGFNMGNFKRRDERDEDTGLLLEVFTNPGRTSSNADRAMADAINAARIFTAYFGPLPYSRIAVTEQPAGFFGQAWPTLVYMPFTAMLGGGGRVRGGGLRLDSMTSFPETVGAHELAHQWWGHLVGWRSYRDQWLSEGFSQFSAGLWLELTSGQGRARTFWKDTRKSIVGKTIFDQFPHEAGPLTQGFRLHTHRSKGASDLIYSKGAYVLHMLRMMMQSPRGGDEAFTEMMKDFTSTLGGRHATTADFQAVVERHMSAEMDMQKDRKMDWFFRQWVHGTMVPAAYELDVRTESAGASQLRISGSLRQTGVPEDFRMLVPLYLDLGGDRIVRIGRIPCVGTAPVPLDVTVPVAKVRKVLVNANLDVLTRE
jgi:hypothetical protein